ncbi:alpha/beta hydrolase [Lewinella sp. W8]|uniref:alpha/beta hydrolase n=1 Tax=Lewinella sp. W8 TaxID=2528208 RepID=UPI0010680BB2|nr:alpha/beta hydrolase-fold protein [Lewinella sp. W8]MTB53534.1 alpha/beta hydrolase [Lewinella sp. W8]
MRTVIAVISLVLLSLTAEGQVISQAPFSIGETLVVRSSVLQEDRTINVYLPASYAEDSIRKYPVIYLLDGSRGEDFIHVSGIVQFCSFSWINIIEESIVVGIGNVDRRRDFTYPSSEEIDRKEFPSSGASAAFITFMDQELQRLINEKYRTTDNRTLIGQSLGGLLATEILFSRPDLFDHYIIVSPSLWWDGERLLERELEKPLKDKSVYVAVGHEGEVMERLAQSLFLKLSLERGEEARLFFRYFEEQNHGDALHLAVYDAFEKLFGGGGE